jgi:hypothetical protein
VQKLETGGWPRYRWRMADLPSAQELFILVKNFKRDALNQPF